MASGILRVHWLPGTDQLLGTCHCGAQHTALDPVELWDWLHAHPVGHRGGAADDGPEPEPQLESELELESLPPSQTEPSGIRVLTSP
jgi:hypothetical protein